MLKDFVIQADISEPVRDLLLAIKSDPNGRHSLDVLERIDAMLGITWPPSSPDDAPPPPPDV